MRKGSVVAQDIDLFVSVRLPWCFQMFPVVSLMVTGYFVQVFQNDIMPELL